MNLEASKAWHDRNRYAFVAISSLFVLLSAVFQLLTLLRNANPVIIGGSIVEALAAGFLALRCSALASSADATLWDLRNAGSLIEDRLDQLERLKRRDLVTLGEYTAKRQEILKDL